MKENTTSAKNWLKMDLEGQSGAIWTDEKSEFQNEKTILPLFSDEDEPEENVLNIVRTLSSKYKVLSWAKNKCAKSTENIKSCFFIIWFVF